MRPRAPSRNNETPLLRLEVRHPLVNVTLFAERCTDGEVAVHSVAWGVVDSVDGRPTAASGGSRLALFARRLKRFLDGAAENLDFRVTLEGYSPFQRDVLTAARTISWGATVSYEELACMSGHPSAVRAVAAVLRNNRLPLVIPCHRVISKSGGLGGFMGAMAGRPVALKRKLLANEGVIVA